MLINVSMHHKNQNEMISMEIGCLPHQRGLSIVQYSDKLKFQRQKGGGHKLLIIGYILIGDRPCILR